MSLIENYEKHLLELEKVTYEKLSSDSNEYENIEAYFKRIKIGINALKINNYSKEEFKTLEINTINAHFKILEQKLYNNK